MKGQNACKAYAVLVDSLCSSAEMEIVLSGRQACIHFLRLHATAQLRRVHASANQLLQEL